MTYLTPCTFHRLQAKHHCQPTVDTTVSQERLCMNVTDCLLVSSRSVQPTKLEYTNIFKVPKVPKKAALEEPVPVAVPKKPEPAPAQGTCCHEHCQAESCCWLPDVFQYCHCVRIGNSVTWYFYTQPKGYFEFTVTFSNAESPGRKVSIFKSVAFSE